MFIILFFKEHARLNVWILDGDGYHKDLLKYVITPESIRNIVIILTIDISRPWTVMDSLEQWTRILREHLHKLKISAKEMNEIEENCELYSFVLFMFLSKKIVINDLHSEISTKCIFSVVLLCFLMIVKRFKLELPVWGDS